MENRASIRRLTAGIAAGLALALAGATEASAQHLPQHLEAEPNNLCTSAQDLSAATLPATVAGSLDTPPATPDVDFYRFSATPGSVVTIRHSQAGAQPLGDPYLAVLRGDCAYMYIDSDGGGGVDAMARITVPDDGVFVVGAAASGDWSFTGTGGSSGTYVVSVQQEQVAQSIGGRLVDSRTGQPAAWAYMTLQRCSGGECEDAGSAYSSYDGTFSFVSGDWTAFGQPLIVGDYRIAAFLASYQDGVFGPFSLAEGQALELGDLAVKSFPVRINLGQACDDVPAAGGTCSFTVDVANGNAGNLEGEVWNVVEAWGIGSPSYNTVFQVGTQRTISLGPGASANVPFSFTVPGAVPNGAYICLSSFVGQRPHNFETLGSHDLFCLSKGVGGFSLVPEQHKGELMRARKAGGTRK